MHFLSLHVHVCTMLFSVFKVFHLTMNLFCGLWLCLTHVYFLLIKSLVRILLGGAFLCPSPLALSIAVIVTWFLCSVSYKYLVATDNASSSFSVVNLLTDLNDWLSLMHWKIITSNTLGMYSAHFAGAIHFFFWFENHLIVYLQLCTQHQNTHLRGWDSFRATVTASYQGCRGRGLSNALLICAMLCPSEQCSACRGLLRLRTFF